MRKLIMLTSCNGLLLCSGWGSPAFYYVYNPSTNLFKRLPQPDNSHDFSILHATGVLRMAFDPKKSRDYKVVQLFACLHAELQIQVYSSETGNWSLCRDHVAQGSNFLQSFGGREGSYDPMFIQIDIHAILHLQKRLFESRGCLLLVSRDDIESKEFTIYEMMKECLVWTVSYVVNTDEFMTPLPDRWSICFTVWSIGLGEREEMILALQNYYLRDDERVFRVSICLGEREEDAFVVINLSEKVIKYNLISKTNTEIFDIESNQIDDDDDDDAVLFIPPFEVDPNLYEFIPSLASV
ncbi:hypothetical protein Tco_1437363 [Tanacetum coccineum]